MRTYILEFVSNGICRYLYLMGTCIRMRTYILEFVSNGICGYLWVLIFDEYFQGYSTWVFIFPRLRYMSEICL